MPIWNESGMGGEAPGALVAKVSIGATSATIKAANDARKSITIQNTGTTRITVGTGTVVAGEGIILEPAGAADTGDGGSFTLTEYTGEITGIGSGAGGTVTYFEEI